MRFMLNSLICKYSCFWLVWNVVLKKNKTKCMSQNEWKRLNIKTHTLGHPSEFMRVVCLWWNWIMLLFGLALVIHGNNSSMKREKQPLNNRTWQNSRLELNFQRECSSPYEIEWAPAEFGELAASDKDDSHHANAHGRNCLHGITLSIQPKIKWWLVNLPQWPLKALFSYKLIEYKSGIYDRFTLWN